MKPMGTITKYYPFIDDDTKSILDTLMDEASNYYDFVGLLCKTVLENEVPINLGYLAAVNAWWCRTEKNMNLIREKYGEVPCIRPWTHLHATASSDQAKYHDAVVQAIEEAMDTSLEDWMETEIHLLHAFYHWPSHGDMPNLLEPIEKAENLIRSNPRLTCFDSLLCAFKAMAKRREGDSKGAIPVYQRGQQIAETHGDSLYKYMNQMGMANTLRHFNIQESLALFEELYDLAQNLEVPYLMAEVLNDSSMTFERAGEYDLAISCHIEGIKIFGGGDAPSLLLSRIYSTLGDGWRALEWAEEAFKWAENLEIPTLYLQKAWALALLNKLEEAEHNLDIAHPLIMKVGNEGALSEYYRISGVIEFKRGNLLDALDFLEQALEISEQSHRGGVQNIVFLDLVRVELAIESHSKDSTKGATLGKWLSKLEEYAIEYDYPGIRMYAALLKSEFYQNNEQLKDALAILQDALTITDSLGVQTLKQKIKSRIKELMQLIQEKKVS